MAEIEKIFAREVLDSRGLPTVETEIFTSSGVSRAVVPSGASTGKHEALELRNGGKRYMGLGVQKAAENVNKIIAKKLLGLDCREQKEIDHIMIELDGTENKTKLGANAILSVSMAVCKAGSLSQGLDLYKYVSKITGNKKLVIPVPQILMLEGGKHADSSTDFQEFMVMPVGAKNFREALRFATEVYHTLKKIMKSSGYPTNVGYEGGFAPSLKSNGEAFEFITQAIEDSGYGKEIFIAIDSAASEFFKNGKYNLSVENRLLTSGEMIDFYSDLVKKYPIISIEDGLAEDEWEGWAELTRKLGNKIQIVGDDLIVTNVRRIRKALALKAINSALIKLTQIGTVTETLNAIRLVRENGLSSVLSQRGGETEDTFKADFVVGTGLGQCKFGGPTRSERTCKYNRLLRIEEGLGSRAKYAGKEFRSV